MLFKSIVYQHYVDIYWHIINMYIVFIRQYHVIYICRKLFVETVSPHFKRHTKSNCASKYILRRWCVSYMYILVAFIRSCHPHGFWRRNPWSLVADHWSFYLFGQLWSWSSLSLFTHVEVLASSLLLEKRVVFYSVQVQWFYQTLWRSQVDRVSFGASTQSINESKGKLYDHFGYLPCPIFGAQPRPVTCPDSSFFGIY